MNPDNWGLLGHEWAVEMLKQYIIRDSIRHAYLFCGPPGLGRRSLALCFAKALNCPNPPSPGEFCGICKTCQQIDRMQYADLAIIQSDKEGGTLKVEQVRAVRQSLSLKPYQGNYRIAIFLRFQEANASAANALLKTLEEAPRHVVLSLTADTPEQLLPTITSRCELLRLRPLPVETVEAYLRLHNADEKTARLIAHLSGGRPGFALRLLQDEGALEFRSGRLDEMQKLLHATRQERFAYAEKITSRKKKEVESEESLRETLSIWLTFWRDVLMRVAGSNSPLVNVDHNSQIDSLASKINLTDASRLVNDTVTAIGRLEKNVNARLLTEVLLLDWPRLS